MIKTDITIKSGETTLKALIARPDEVGGGSVQKRPAIVVIHEIMGLSEHMVEMTERIAGQGYVALALDLFSAGNMAICIWKCLSAVRSGETNHFAVHYLQSAIDYLAQQNDVDASRIGAIGFCMGGNFAISLACEDKRIKTIAPFYSITPSKMDFDKLCPVVGSYPSFDLTKKSGEEMQAGLAKTSIPHDIKIYPGTTHCFLNEKLPFMYNQDAAQDSWQRTMAFFDQHLVGARA